MKRVDVLWLVEHVSREMDVACAVKYLAKRQCGIDIHIRNMYHAAQETMLMYEPRVVVHPFFYFFRGALATEDYVRTWPTATHFNLAWEQIFYPFHATLKAPSDEVTRTQVLHHAWGSFYQSFLQKNGVPKQHIFVNGHPAYQLYKQPYRGFFLTRQELAKRYRLRHRARWIFIPENYRWAFIDEGKIQRLVDQGANRAELVAMKEFSRTSLQILVDWCQEIGKHKKVEIIFRPRPTTQTADMTDFIRKRTGKEPVQFHIIKQETVREWILASDIVVSSFSTSLLEASVAKKPVYMVEPIPIPSSLWCDWYRMVPKIKTREQFIQLCKGAVVSPPKALEAWVHAEMLAHGDPIAGLVSHVCELVRQSSSGSASMAQRIRLLVRRRYTAFFPRNYFNHLTHEQDIFTQKDVLSITEKWSRILRRYAK